MCIRDSEDTFHAEIDHSKPKFYALVEFPYPSAAGLHVGHPRSYTCLLYTSYLADMTSAERDWPGVDDLRALEMQDLDRALCDALKRSIDFGEEKGGSLDPESVAAYEYAKAHLE